jgi:hypothetical protein
MNDVQYFRRPCNLFYYCGPRNRFGICLHSFYQRLCVLVPVCSLRIISRASVIRSIPTSRPSRHMTGRSSRCPARRRLPGGRKPLLHPRDRPVVSERAVGLCPHRSYRRRAVTLARRRDAASRLQREAPRVPVSVSHGCTRHADCTPSTFATLAARSPHHPCRLKGAKGGTVWWSTIVLVSSSPPQSTPRRRGCQFSAFEGRAAVVSMRRRG